MRIEKPVKALCRAKRKEEKVFDILLSCCIQLLVVALSRHAESRLANGFCAACDVTSRHAQPGYIPILRVLLNHRIQRISGL
ncbi:unnamed protein product [Timema podura]|uniref:Uncharacterized protein n=1 Tax=Timema podura TaxID=61482 RepID=A0ABN7ND55_TIMPD|nr:unnamed protein product [Timema podura]